MYGGRVIDSYDRRIIRTYMKEYFGNFVFDYFQPFHFFIDQYDYFIPEIRDFLSIKQRWLLKEANISVCNLSILIFYTLFIDFRLNHRLNIISKNFYRIKFVIYFNVISKKLKRNLNFYLKMFFLTSSLIFRYFESFIWPISISYHFIIHLIYLVYMQMQK
jgi:hypothetical protein